MVGGHIDMETYLGGCFDAMVGGHIDMETYLGGCFDVMVGGHIGHGNISRWLF